MQVYEVIANASKKMRSVASTFTWAAPWILVPLKRPDSANKKHRLANDHSNNRIFLAWKYICILVSTDAWYDSHVGAIFIIAHFYYKLFYNNEPTSVRSCPSSHTQRDGGPI